jgi:magnesium transporter
MFQKFSIENDQFVENGAHPVIWLLRTPTPEEKASVLKTFPIDEHNLTSALDPEEPSRIEVEPDHRVIIIKYPQNYSGGRQFLFKVASLGFFLFKDRLLVVLNDKVDPFAERPCRTVQSVNDVFLKVILGAIRHYQEHLRVISMISDSIEEKLSVSTDNKYILNLFSLEKSLVYYLNAINANGYVLERLKVGSERLGLLNTQDQELLEDIIIENTQSFRQAEIYSNILASLMDARASIVNNNLNILMKTLNLITICIMVPNLVVSVFSMNVAFPAQHTNWAFWGILVAAAISMASVLLWWNNRGR